MSDPTVPILLVTGGLVVFAAGVLVGHVATRWGLDRDRERVEVRKDTAVEAALETAFELQERELRDSGEHAMPAPDTWAMDGTVLPADYPPRCGNCGRAATHVYEDDYVCVDCLAEWWPDLIGVYVVLGEDPATAEDDTTLGPRTVPGPWRPATPGRRK